MLKSGKHDPAFYRNLWATILAGRTWRGNITNRNKQGSLYVTEQTITPVRSKAGAITHFVAIMNDVTEQRAAEEALYASERRFREMADHLHDVFWSITSRDGLVIHYVSPAYEQIWGRPVAEIYARPALWIESVVAEDRQAVLAARAGLARGEQYRIEYRINRPDGTVRWIESCGYPVRDATGVPERAVCVSSDITGRKQLAEQLLQAQKMEAIGQLAGGIAHDFNNSLTIITGYATLLLDHGHFPEPKAEQLREIYSAGVRAGNLTKQLLLFSRKQAMHRRAINVNGHITELVKMLGRLIGEHIRLAVDLTPELPLLDADVSMVEQILMNLAVNARDAMPHGGVLTLATAQACFDVPGAARHPDRRPGRFIRITVSDTGCGIPPENMTRIFEPFYTTKPAGLGTGLGLATVFGIVHEHGGWIEVDSKVGSGTQFAVFLPTCPDHTVSAHPLGEIVAAQGSETILLVEDEASVRDFIVAVLDHYGYRVLQAASGVDAREVWHRHAARIALLLTDMVLPDGVSGAELAEQVQAEKPAIKVVLMSGYTSELVGQLYTRRPSTRFIQKPFQPNALAQIVREALDEAVAAPGAAAGPPPAEAP
jgi:PAS domain S-box-containing protein